jgi:hypothetical protein
MPRPVAFRPRAAGPAVRVFGVDADSGSTVNLVLLGIAVVLAIVGVVTRPFLFEPLAVICLLVSARSTKSRRFTGPVVALITVCFILGAALAASGSHPLY